VPRHHPHGASLLAQGAAFPQAKGPAEDQSRRHDPVHGRRSHEPDTNPAYLKGYDVPLPPGIPVGAIKNPNLVLTEAIKHQTIVSTLTISVSTKTPGGITNMPFVVQNADAVSMESIFWIGNVQLPGGQGTFLQLQYSQTVLLRFLGLDWPHISVATLVKTF
jgi:hypothetical protein